jgi:hypothetical protein
MPIIGFNIKSMHGKNNEKAVTGEININSVPKIINIEKKDIGVLKDIVSITFNFNTAYEPKIGEIGFDGEILYQADDVKKIMKTWKDEKKMDDSITAEVFNVIFRRCLTRAASISEELRLPPPIRFPVVLPKEQEEKK